MSPRHSSFVNLLSRGPGSDWQRRGVFWWRALLVAAIAVIGEIAAVLLASALQLGVAAASLALGGLVLSVGWLLRRSAR